MAKNSIGMNRRSFIKTASAISMTGAVAGCIGDSGGSNTVTIGAMGPLSGAYAVYGENGQKGAELAVNKLNDEQDQVEYELETADTEGSPSTGVQRARQLVQDGDADVLLGFASSAVLQAVAEFAANEDVIVLGTIAQTPSIVEEPNCRENVFRTSASDVTINTGLARATAELTDFEEPVTIASIIPDYVFGRETYNTFLSEFENQVNNVEVVSEASPELGKGEYQNEIQNIIDEEPDILYTSFLGSDLDALIQQGKQRGLFDIVSEFVNGGSAIMNTSLSFGQEMVEMIASERYYFQYPDTERNLDFVSNYRDNYGEIPVNVAQENYAGVLAVHGAIEATDGGTSKDDMISGLEGLEFESPEGTKKIRAEDHQVIEENIWAGRLQPLRDYNFYGFTNMNPIPGAEVTPEPKCNFNS